MKVLIFLAGRFHVTSMFYLKSLFKDVDDHSSDIGLADLRFVACNRSRMWTSPLSFEACVGAALVLDSLAASYRAVSKSSNIHGRALSYRL